MQWQDVEIKNERYAENVKRWNQIYAIMDSMRIKDRETGITKNDVDDIKYFINSLSCSGGDKND